jgi:hypothetical protein
MKNFIFKGDYRRRFVYDLVSTWHKILTDYEEKMTDDLPYFYIERTNLGLLAAAALKMGALPLEEYSADKGRGKKKYPGRADLWIRAKNGATYDFEAKQKWISLNSNNVISITDNILTEAVKAARQIALKSDFSLGIGFIVPYVSDYVKDKAASFNEQILNIRSIGADFSAVHFCDKRYWGKIKVEEKYYPGICIIGKYI